MNNSSILKKGVVTEIISKTEYVIEDVLTKEKLTMIVPNKFRMNYFKIELGTTFYITLSSSEEKKGTIVLPATFITNDDLFTQKIAINKEQEIADWKAIITIARIKEKVSPRDYLVEDIFDGDLINMKMSGKQRMNYRDLEIGEEIYVQRSPYEPQRGRLATGTDFKMDESGKLNQAKFEANKKREMNNWKAILTIAKVKEQSSPTEFVVEDIFDNELISMSMSGKMQLNYKPKIGEEVYVQRSPYDSERGRLATTSTFKMDHSGKLGQAKMLIDKWRKEKKI